MTDILHIEPGVHALLAGAAAATYGHLQLAQVGQVISDDGDGTEVRRWALANAEGGEEVFFLKRRGREPRLRLLSAWAHFRRAHSGPWREMQAAVILRAAGFAAMEPVAWGERVRAGLPVAGFVLVKAIPGRSAAAVFDEAPPAKRTRLMGQIGALVGRLHAHGFFHIVRLKDLIALETATGDFKLTLIDRETSKPWARSFSVKVAQVSLARATRRTLREGHRLSTRETISFLRAYSRELATLWPVSLRVLSASVLKQVRTELTGGKRGRGEAGAKPSIPR